ncbi:MAG: Re/Si-specific NAD(P)(+) transhydrogenase subunit alpha [Actinomycetota bacterium]
MKNVGVARETFPGERRVALTPAVVPQLAKAGIEVVVESRAGLDAGFTDEAYREKGAKIAPGRSDAFATDAILQVRSFGANPDAGKTDLDLVRPDQVVIGFSHALWGPEVLKELASRKATAFAMELMPRITRAQSMDALSSQATISGYKAVLLAADHLQKMFPMLTTAAGTIAPARVLVLGAGVAGLQAIATARRLGAVVEAYDVRPAVKEQVESLGAKFVELELETEGAEGAGGYAKEQSEEFLKKQREALGRVIAANDAVITTALVPGAEAPVLMTAEMVRGMAPGSVVVDIAAEQGGNVELTRPDEVVEDGGVTIIGPTNLPASVPHHASQMYAKNISAFLLHLFKEGELQIDPEDEITRETLITRGGEVVHPRVREVLGLPQLDSPKPEAVASAASDTEDRSQDK